MEGSDVYVADALNQRIRHIKLPVVSLERQQPLQDVAAITRRLYEASLLAAGANPYADWRVPGSAAVGLKVLVYQGETGVYHDQHQIGIEMNNFFNKQGASSKTSRDISILANLSNDKIDVAVAHIDAGRPTLQECEGIANFVKGGGGFVGIHTAVAGFAYGVPPPGQGFASLCKPYHAMLNGIFDGHSAYQDYPIRILRNATSPITKGLGDFVLVDELYYPKQELPALSTTLTQSFDVTDRKAGEGEVHPHFWQHEYEKGRVCYLASGHDAASNYNPMHREMLWRAVLWSARRLDEDEEDVMI